MPWAQSSSYPSCPWPAPPERRGILSSGAALELGFLQPWEALLLL